ncbi:MAG: hypothetical protein K5984_07445 [Bacteroidales bacterium]|nr:hypothetical protein [Bacteroidales bacterium]
MKKSIYSASAILILGSCLCACDDAYDLSNVNSEITVIPGLSVSINQSLDAVSSNEMLDLAYLESSSAIDSDGNYLVRSNSSVIDTWIQNEDLTAFNAGTPFALSNTLTLDYNLPDFFKNAKSNLIIPTASITIRVENYTDCTISGKATPKGATAGVAFSSVVNSNGEALLESDDIKALFSNNVEQIVLSDLKIKRNASLVSTGKPATKSVVQQALKIEAYSDFALSFAKGSVFEFSYTFDLEELGLDFSKFSFTADKFSAMMDITNSLPVTIEVESVTADVNASVAVSPAIAAGSVAIPETTTVTAEVTSNSKISEIKTVTCVIKASNKADNVVTLNKGQSLTIAFKNITLTSGITVDL